MSKRKGTEVSVVDESRLATVDHVADFCHRYPGEVVTFFTRVSVRRSLSSLTLRVSLPKELELEKYQPPTELDGMVPGIQVEDHVNYLIWSFEGHLPAGTHYEYQAQARVGPAEQDVNIESHARATSGGRGILAEETATVNVQTRGQYLRYLPELYANDELMSRFLMFFESFWSPIETQIGSTHCYFDPEMTPSDFLPWLASWMGLEPDEHLSKERQRQLIRSAVSLHRKRGTKQGLQEYLETYTGGEVQIIEHRAHNFNLGADARLGPGIALGRTNLPHTFTVILHLPPVNETHGISPKERTRREKERRRAIKAIIEAEKPAYTAYTLHIET